MAIKVVIFGTASFAELVHEYLNRDSGYDVVAFTVHRANISEPRFRGLPVVAFEGIAAAYPPASHQMFVAVGYKQVNQVRAAIYTEAKAKGYTLLTYVSPRCTNMAASIGDNCFVFEDNTLQPFVTVGNNVILWSGNHIGHHSTIGDHCYITSHVVVSGHCRIGAYCFLGVNSTLRDSLTIAERCVIGAGALIMKDTRPKEVYLGERTKPFPKNSDDINL
ncbi:MAG TPA: acetyltransferase [Vicinamibacterales bacterium]|nr:acetyltransferase [Vicinamibacterales bacterium]